eukprot:gene5107-34909_t
MDRLMAMRSELHGPSEEMRSYEVIPDANPSQDSGDSDSSPAIQLVDISSGLGSTEYGSPSRKLKAVPALDPVDEQTESDVLVVLAPKDCDDSHARGDIKGRPRPDFCR